MGVQQHFEDTFNDPLCHGLVEDIANTNYSSFENVNGHMELNILTNSYELHQRQPQFEAGTQFGGNVCNPYAQSRGQQFNAPSNPYTKPPRQASVPIDKPPMQEVVDPSHIGAQGGLKGGGGSQSFEDAFL